MSYPNIAAWENANPYEDLDERTEEEDSQRRIDYYETLETFKENENE